MDMQLYDHLKTFANEKLRKPWIDFKPPFNHLQDFEW